MGDVVERPELPCADGGPNSPRSPEALLSDGKKPRPYHYEGWGILNPWGELWCPEWFERPGEARKHVTDFFHGFSNCPDLTGFQVVPVNIDLTVMEGAEALPLFPPDQSVGRESDDAAPERTNTPGRNPNV